MSSEAERLAESLSGRYAIERELARGGMATVYVARDLRHDRRVALKVVQPELAHALGRDRFLHEIETAARLNHPHIVPLFDSGEAGDLLYYVMPYIEGESLRDRLNREKQLAVPDTVGITRQVATALQYAHDRGLIHRDIKPENILLHEGEAMVTDFGIAVAMASAGGQRLTATGISVGTPQYMSPEQAMGAVDLDGRTDIYSLGTVAYEMLAGEPPHAARSPQAVLARIVSEPARPVSEFREFVPRHVVDAIRKALAKRPIDRFSTATELIAAIDDPSWSLPDTNGRPVGPRRWTALTTAFAGLSAVLSGALLFHAWRGASTSEPTSRTAIAVPASEAIRSIAPSGGGGPRIALTPDGATLIYEGPLMDGARIWVRRLGELNGRPIPGTENGFSPFPSPDGSRLAFLRAPASDPDLQRTSITLHTMTLDGREEATLLTGQLGLALGGSWGTDGFLYVQGTNGTIIRVPERGGVTTPVTTLDSAADERRHLLPDVLPSAGAMLMTVRFAGGADSIAAVNLSTMQHQILIEGNRAVFMPPGYVVIAGADGSLRAARFDPRRLRLTSTPVEIARDVQSISGQASAWSELAASRGTVAYLVAALERSLVWVAPDGSVEEDLDPDWRARFRNLALSPDAKRLAVSINQENGMQIWVKDIPGGAPRQLTFEGANDRPSWHPDGERVLFRRIDGSGNHDLFEQRADGSEAARLVIAQGAGSPLWEGQWSRDGQWLIYRTGPPTRDIFATRPGRDTTVTISAGAAQELFPAVSPSGRFVAYTSNESGRNDIWVRPFPVPARARWLASTNGGVRPLWSRDGRHLYYWTDDLQLVGVPVQESGTVFTKGSERVLFSYPFLGIDNQPYQQGPDGRFLVVRREETAQLVIVRNVEREIERGGSR
jgi:serine/threonine protein kinase